MDPNENLTEQLRLSQLFIDTRVDRDDPECGNSLPDDDVMLDNALRLAELVQALHGWIVKGGALPVIWEESREREKRA